METKVSESRRESHPSGDRSALSAQQRFKLLNVSESGVVGGTNTAGAPLAKVNESALRGRNTTTGSYCDQSMTSHFLNRHQRLKLQ